ncbi:LPXTG cell wall anchor domain-containing protein [Micromonospora peucetia]|uniref:LPXTG cell wall anchor domain-containing protein n=1 Tax=Micromonospora peucetia TaxID=47871 RepID=A0ABZ1EKP8_9ACTN|nr:LPXTG cell wall anchor domain-containing protein [Micromonospora peucetia]WSA34801.1 LPXTG cell wall anchor domain-containing protein [Micromonospora peucetia]
MLKHSTRRWLAGLGVAGAIVAASASPASAEDTDVKLGVYTPNLTIAAGSVGKYPDVILSASAPVVLPRGFTVQYDYTDLVGKVTVKEEQDSGSDCTSPSAGLVTCTIHHEYDLDEGGTNIAGLFQVVVAPTDKAKDGDSGKLIVTLNGSGLKSVSHDATVRVGEGVDLDAGPETNLSLAPGTKFTAPLKVSNAGEHTAKGASVLFMNDYGLNAGKHYSNCTYVGDALRSCQFTENLPAGATFGTTLPYVLGKDAFAPGFKYGEILWMTPAEFEDYQGYLDSRGGTLGKPGTDGKLDLTEENKASRGAQADTNPDNDWSSLAVTVTGENSTDLEAIGAKLTGKAGDKVKAAVGVRNNGPATLDHGRAGSSITYMTVDVPKGTSAVAVPKSCAPVEGDNWGEPGEPGARQYRCYFETFLKAGDEAVMDFELRIDTVIANATGLVKVNVPCKCDGGFYKDLKPANDTAKLLVNATGGQGGGDGDGDGDGGTLPITGESTGLIAGIGGLLLVAGVGGYVITKRRKTRFVA